MSLLVLKKNFISICCCLFLLLSSNISYASWLQDKKLSVILNGHDIRLVLQEFSNNLGYNAVIDKEVIGKVTLNMKNTTPRMFLDELAKNNGIDWFFDGEKINYSMNKNNIKRIMKLRWSTWQEVIGRLKNAGIYNYRHPIKLIDSTLATVSGPRGYIELIEVVISDIAKAPTIIKSW